MVVGVFAVYVVCCSLLGEIGKDVLAVATDSSYEILHETHFVADFVVDPRGCVLVFQEGRNSSRRELSFYSSEPPPEAPSGSRNACSNATCGKKTGLCLNHIIIMITVLLFRRTIYLLSYFLTVSAKHTDLPCVQ